MMMYPINSHPSSTSVCFDFAFQSTKCMSGSHFFKNYFPRILCIDMTVNKNIQIGLRR